MSLWELRACIDGVQRANGVAAAPKAPSGDQHRARIAALKAKGIC